MFNIGHEPAEAFASHSVNANELMLSYAHAADAAGDVAAISIRLLPGTTATQIKGALFLFTDPPGAFDVLSAAAAVAVPSIPSGFADITLPLPANFAITASTLYTVAVVGNGTLVFATTDLIGGAGIAILEGVPFAGAIPVEPDPGAWTGAYGGPIMWAVGAAGSGSGVNRGVRLRLRDTDSGALHANLGALSVAVRADSQDDVTLYKTSAATTDASGVLVIDNDAVGVVGAQFDISIRNAARTLMAFRRGVVVDLNTADVSDP
jgi:hypothetical protein